MKVENAHIYVIEINQNLVNEVFRERKKRRIGDIELYLSVIPQDIPKVKIKNIPEEREKIIVEFKFVNVNIENWGNVLLYKNEKTGLEVYQDFIHGYIRTIKIPINKINEFQSEVENIRQRIEKELANMNWNGKKVAELDMKERQLYFLTKLEILQEIKIFVKIFTNNI